MDYCYSSWQCTYCTGWALSWLRIWCPLPGKLSETRDKAELNPLQHYYIAIAESFASLKKELQFITSYLFWLLKVQLGHILVKQHKASFHFAMNNKPLSELTIINFCATQTFQMRSLILSAMEKLDRSEVPRMLAFLSWYFWACLWCYLWEYSDIRPKSSKQYT